MSDETKRHVYRVSETVEHTILADRAMSGPELKRAVDRARGDGDPEPGVEIHWDTARTWVGPGPTGGSRTTATAAAPIVDSVDDTYD